MPDNKSFPISNKEIDIAEIYKNSKTTIRFQMTSLLKTDRKFY